MNSNSKKIISALALVVSLTGAMSASAMVSRTDQSESVTFSDLDLSKKDGQEVLYRRLKNTAAQVCDSKSVRYSRSLSHMAQSKACYKKSLDSAVAKVASPALSKLHNS